MSDQPFERIPGRYGLVLTRTGESTVSGHVPALPSLFEASGAALRPAALLMGIDMASGLSAGLAALPAWSVTADTDVHFLAPCRKGPLRIDASCIRAGRHMAIAQARLHDEGDDDRLVAVATANHGLLVPKFEPFLAGKGPGASHVFPVPEHPPEQSLEDYFGLRVEGGAARLPLDERTTNPWGFLHGGLHGLLVDALVGAAGLPAPRSACLRFLNPVRNGAAEARIVERHERGDGALLRIEVRDTEVDRLALVAQVEA